MREKYKFKEIKRQSRHLLIPKKYYISDDWFTHQILSMQIVAST